MIPVRSIFRRSGLHMLIKLKHHDVLQLLENIKSYISSHSYAESSHMTMTEDRLVELLGVIILYLQYLQKCCSKLLLPSMTQYELLQNVCGNVRDFHGLQINGCVEYGTIEYVLPQLQLMAQRVVNFCLTLLDYRLDERDKSEEIYESEISQFNSKLANLLVEIAPVVLEVMHICSTKLIASKSAEVGCFIKQFQEVSPDILREYLIHLQQHMINAITPSTSVGNIHVMIEFLLIILTDVSKDVIRRDKLLVLLARVGALIREVAILVCNLKENSMDEEKMNEICASQHLLENLVLLKEDLKHVFLKVPANSSQLCFPMSDGPLFMTLLLRNLNDLLNSNAYSVALIKEEIGLVKEDLELIRSFFGKVEQELNRDLWARVLDVAYEAEHAINSILARDHGLVVTLKAYLPYQLRFMIPVRSIFRRSGLHMLIKLKHHDVLQLLENIKSYISSHSYAESSHMTMTEDRLVELLGVIILYLQYLQKCCSKLLLPSMTQYELLQNVCGNVRDFHGLQINGCVEYGTIEYVLPQLQLMAQRVVNFCLTLLDYRLDERDKSEEIYESEISQFNSKLANLLVEIAPVVLEVMHICSTKLIASKSAEVGCFIKQFQEVSPDILREYLIHLQQHMINAITPSTSVGNIHVMIEFLLIILTDVSKDVIRRDKLLVLLARLGALIREVAILVCNLKENSMDEEKMNEICASQHLLENLVLLKEDLKHVFLKVPANSSQLCFPMSDGPLFMTLLLRNLNDLLNSNAYSVALIKEEIGLVKEDLELIRSFFGKVEQELNRDLWARVLDVAYEAEHAINSILARDHGLMEWYIHVEITLFAYLGRLGPAEYNRVPTCTTAKEIWDALVNAHEGTSQWNVKVTTIKEENKDLAGMSLDELVGNLRTYEIQIDRTKMVAAWGFDLDDDEFDKAALTALGDSDLKEEDDASEVSILELKEKLHLFSKTKLIFLMSALIDDFQESTSDRDELFNSFARIKFDFIDLEACKNTVEQENCSLKK
ncbi:hypothetical protein BC332_14465 [Capsicum chinense]|nr:hypothetical protein BC332_14465 [Capsicum chinense]